MAEVIKTGDVGLLTGKVAVLGYGSQGHAHALNLADSGDRRRGRAAAGQLVARGRRGGRAEGDGRRRGGARTRRSSRSSCPTASQAALYRDEVAPNLRAGRGAPLRARLRDPLRARSSRPPANDVIMVAPKGPGHIVRRIYEEGYGTPALIAVAQDASGQRARPRARVRGRDRRRPRRDHRDDVHRTRPRPTSSASSPCSAAGSRS